MPRLPLFALVSLVSLGVGAARAELPEVRDAHVVRPPPGAPVAAGYLTLVNGGDDELVISGASSPTVGRVELHRSLLVDDVARMERQERLVVPPGDSLTLERGGYHLMLMEIGDGLAAGDDVVVVLETSAGALELTMPVRGPDGAATHGGGGHGDGHGGGNGGGTMKRDGAAAERPPAVLDVK